jgi:hypothetical protein
MENREGFGAVLQVEKRAGALFRKFECPIKFPH